VPITGSVPGTVAAVGRRGVVAINEGASGVPLFLPFALGGHISGHELAGVVPNPMLGLVPPDGVDAGDMAALATALADVIESVQPPGPYALAGYSFAGMLAYELAGVLTARGRPPAALVVIDVGPSRAWTSRGALRTVLLGLGNVPRWLLDAFRSLSMADLARLAARKTRAVASAAAIKVGLMAPRGEAVRFESMYGDLTMPAAHRLEIEAHLRALMTQPPRRYGGPLTLIRANVRPLQHSFEPDLGWRAVVDGPVEVVRVAANHTTIMQPPHLTTVGRVIAERLERVG
jgi:phthiocerol/phenolphthiocerol synthesis type-I polyketide synthase D